MKRNERDRKLLEAKEQELLIIQSKLQRLQEAEQKAIQTIEALKTKLGINEDPS